MVEVVTPKIIPKVCVKEEVASVVVPLSCNLRNEERWAVYNKYINQANHIRHLSIIRMMGTIVFQLCFVTNAKFMFPIYPQEQVLLLWLVFSER